MKPNPGSDEAIKLGCLCPVIDNCHGNMPNDNYWINSDCHLHNQQSDGDYMYKCSQCGFVTLTVEALDEHLLNRHKVIPYHGKDETMNPEQKRIFDAIRGDRGFVTWEEMADEVEAMKTRIKELEEKLNKSSLVEWAKGYEEGLKDGYLNGVGAC